MSHETVGAKRRRVTKVGEKSLPAAVAAQKSGVFVAPEKLHLIQHALLSTAPSAAAAPQLDDLLPPIHGFSTLVQDAWRVLEGDLSAVRRFRLDVRLLEAMAASNTDSPRRSSPTRARPTADPAAPHRHDPGLLESSAVAAVLAAVGRLQPDDAERGMQLLIDHLWGYDALAILYQRTVSALGGEARELQSLAELWQRLKRLGPPVKWPRSPYGERVDPCLSELLDDRVRNIAAHLRERRVEYPEYAIHAVSPHPSCPGTLLTITGTGFGSRGGRVRFPGLPGEEAIVAESKSWSDRKIEVTVPEEAGYGDLSLIIEDGTTELCGSTLAVYRLGSMALDVPTFTAAAVVLGVWATGHSRFPYFAVGDAATIHWDVAPSDLKVDIRVAAGAQTLKQLDAAAAAGQLSLEIPRTTLPVICTLTTTPICGKAATRTLVLNVRVLTAFVFSGGGSLGSFEVGAAKFLMEVAGEKPTILTGTSTGSLVAAKLAEDEGTADLERIWREIDGYQRIYTMQSWFETLRTYARYAHKLLNLEASEIAYHGIAAAAGLALPGPWTIMRVIRDGITVKQALSELADAWQALDTAQALYSNQPLRELVFRHLDPQKVKASGITLRVATVGLQDGRTNFVTEDGLLIDGLGSQRAIDLRDGVLASAAIPLAFPPQRLGDWSYVDGGVREMTPLRVAVRLGAQRVFVILAAKIGLDKKDFVSPKLLDVALRSFENMFDEVRSADLIVCADESELDMVVIAPRVPLHDSLTFDRGLTSIALDYGYMTAADEVTQYTTDVGREMAKIAAATITTLRYDTWAREYALNGEVDPSFDACISPNNTSELTETSGAVDAAGLEAVQSIKLEIKKQIDVRRSVNAPVPTYADDWWQRWELHSWTPVRNGPFDFT